MPGYRLLSAALGLLIAAAIFWLLRRDRLHTRHALWWIGMATAVIGLGLFPQMTDWVASRLEIGYPPILAVIFAFAVVFLKLLQLDLELARHQRMERRLIQKIALMQREIDQLRRNRPPTGSQTPPEPRSSGPEANPRAPSPRGGRPGG